MLIAAFIVGALLGGAAIWLVMRERVAAHRRSRRGRFEQLHARSRRRRCSDNNESFLQLAGSQLKPIADTLKAFDEKTQDLDRERQRAYGSLTTQVRKLAEGQERLRAETGGLAPRSARPTSAAGGARSS